MCLDGHSLDKTITDGFITQEQSIKKNEKVNVKTSTFSEGTNSNNNNNNNNNSTLETTRILDLSEIAKKIRNKKNIIPQVERREDKFIEISSNNNETIMDGLITQTLSTKKNEKIDFGTMTFSEKKVNLEELHKKWHNYLEKLKKESKMSVYNLLKNAKLSIEKIDANLSSITQKDILTGYKQDIAAFLNYPIIINFNIIKSKKTYVPYTNKEKFKYLANKNPMLKEMYEKLELDLDI